MNEGKLTARDSAIDIIRIVAVFCVVSVHFLLYCGFYSEEVHGLPMFVGCIMRTLFTVCVPLFMLLTGYLMNKKVLCKKYYLGIVKTLIIYLIATIVCMIFKRIKFGDELSAKTLLLGLFGFWGANYSWYIEMYIALFLMVPFLNLIYNNLKSQKQKQILVLTFIFITVLPSVFNIYNWDSANWWANPVSSDNFSKLLPDWWKGLYPITYYFTGCYIKEYKLKIKTRTLLVAFLTALFGFSVFNFYRGYGGNFRSGPFLDWGGFESYFLAVFLFILLKRIKTDKFSNNVRKTLWVFSDLALGAYLISYVFDMQFYPILKEAVPRVQDIFPYYFVIVPSIFILSMLASMLMNVAAKLLIIGSRTIVRFVKKEKEKPFRSVWWDILFIFLMTLALIFALWKSRYGFGGDDEAFYLTIPHRMTIGDVFLAKEWHLSQLSGFLMIPFVSLYTAITGSTAGIMLAARISYIVLHAAVAIVVYVRLKKHGCFAVIGAVLFFLFTPYDIMTLSYNTMGLDLVVLTGVLMGTASYERRMPIIISGLAFAGAVLCNPYLIVVYFLFAFAVIAHQMKRKKNNPKSLFCNEIFSTRTFLWFTIGAAVLAVVFALFVLSRVDIGTLFKSLPYLFKDPEHPAMNVIDKIWMYFNSIWNCNVVFKFLLCAYFVVLIIMFVDEKRMLHRTLYLIAGILVTVLSLMTFLPELTSKNYNAIMFPMVFIGIISYILTRKKERNLFIGLFVLGVLYTFAMCFSSNQYFYVISSAATAANIGSYVFLAKLIREMKETPDELDYPRLCKYILHFMLVLMIVLQAGFQIYVKSVHCFWDAKPGELSGEIEGGPAKGIITTETNCENYNKLYYDLESYKSKEKDQVLCLTGRTWIYLALGDYPYGTFSAWLSGETQDSLDRLEQYYKLNPEKVPKYIYIPKASEWDFSNLYQDAWERGFNVEETDVSYKLERVK